MVVDRKGYERRYKIILDKIERRPSSIQDLDLDLSRSQIKRDYLDKMVSRREIAFLSKILKGKNKDFVLEWTADKTWEGKTNKYYFRTPQCEKLYAMLYSLVRNIENKQKSAKLIEEICIIFQTIEISSVAWQNWLNDGNEIKKDLKKRGIRATKENITRKKDRQDRVIKDFYNSKKRIGITYSDTRKINGKDYLVIKDQLVPFEKISKFLYIAYGNFTEMMDYAVFSDKSNLEQFANKLTSKMVELFFELEYQSQVKI